MRKLIPAITMVLMLLTVYQTPSAADMAGRPKIQAGIPAFTILENIALANRQNQPQPDKGAPLITWLAPSDPRLQPHHVMRDPTNLVYAIRNLGGLLAGSTGSVDFGVRHLRTPVLLITASTDWPALALLQNSDAEADPEINKELTPLTKLLSPPGATPSEPLLRRLEKYVDLQVGQAMSRYQDRIDTRRLTVIGGIIDFDNLYHRGQGRHIIININGETDTEKLRKLSIMRRLDQESRAYIGRQGLAVYQPRTKNVVGKPPTVGTDKL